MNLYVYTFYNSKIANTDLGDGKLNIPEYNNNVPDILDEARWEVEFLLKMQVPDGQPKAGMAHHKINDDNWTAIPTAPHEDTQNRKIYWPTTAATLNLAAASAQAARLYDEYDQQFADKCLVAAEKAWEAAVANPKVLFSNYSGTSGGGGDYSDSNVSDEFYWAAAELYITTGKAQYLEYMKSSEYYLKMNKEDNVAFDWASTGACGTLSLSLVPNNLTETEINTARKNIQATADTYLDIISQEGYLVPTRPDAYIWGSNSLVLNKAVVMAYTYGFTKNKDYINGVINSMDYIFGRNAMDKCYVSGYGQRPLKNPHHRFWAYSANPKYPEVFPGTVSGGPNAFEFDPVGEMAGLANNPPQKSYIDDINAWACNEITINWNAPFAWITNYLDDYTGLTTDPIKTTYISPTITPSVQPTTVEPTEEPTIVPTSEKPVSEEPTEEPTTTPITTSEEPVKTTTTNPTSSNNVKYTILNDWGAGATCEVKINATSAINGWSVSWTFSGNQKITNLWAGKFSQNGADVKVTNESWNANIPANGSVSFGFNISYSGSNGVPGDIKLN